LPPSSSGLGHQPFKLEIRGPNPLGGILSLIYLLIDEVLAIFQKVGAKKDAEKVLRKKEMLKA
jgi:hypothetical protein